MTHDPRERVAVCGPDGVRLVWARTAQEIFASRHEGPLTLRGTLYALVAAGVSVVQGAVWVYGECLSVTVDVLDKPAAGAIPRRSGSRVPEAERTRPTVPLAVRVTPDALARLDAAAKRAGLSRSAYVERLAAELPPAIVG